MEKTKQNIIIEHWGVHFDKVEKHLNQYGMCPMSSQNGTYQDLYKSINKHPFYVNEESIETRGEGGLFCPESMPDLKYNNGWIKIESEEDLPEQGGSYYITRYDKTEIAVYIKDNRWLVDGNDYPKTTKLHGITHYQKITTPQSPIY